MCMNRSLNARLGLVKCLELFFFLSDALLVLLALDLSCSTRCFVFYGLLRNEANLINLVSFSP
jgi:hypothetical protein